MASVHVEIARKSECGRAICGGERKRIEEGRYHAREGGREGGRQGTAGSATTYQTHRSPFQSPVASFLSSSVAAPNVAHRRLCAWTGSMEGVGVNPNMDKAENGKKKVGRCS